MTTPTTIDLGGPLAPCSASRLRRLRAGELSGDDQAKAAAHVMSCEACRAAERELDAERAALLREVPFDSFAAGVAEKLARDLPRRRTFAWIPAAAAACLLVGIGVPVALRSRGETDDGVRSKGAALAKIFIKDARGLRGWLPGEPIPESADVHAELGAAGRPFAAVVLAEGSEVHPLFGGLTTGADGKPRVVSFGWTGAHDAVLVIAAGKEPIDVGRLADAVRAAGQGTPALDSAEISSVRLPRR